MNCLFFLDSFLIYINLQLKIFQITIGVVHILGQCLILFFQLNERLHQKILVSRYFGISLNVWIIGLLLLFLQSRNNFMEISRLFFYMKNLSLIFCPNLFQINLIDFIFLLLAEFIKELPLALKLLNGVLVFLDLLLILSDVLLYPEGDTAWRWWAELLFCVVREGSVVGWMVVEVCGRWDVALVIVLSLNAVGVHYQSIQCLLVSRF